MVYGMMKSFLSELENSSEKTWIYKQNLLTEIKCLEIKIRESQVWKDYASNYINKIVIDCWGIEYLIVDDYAILVKKITEDKTGDTTIHLSITCFL